MSLFCAGDGVDGADKTTTTFTREKAIEVIKSLVSSGKKIATGSGKDLIKRVYPSQDARQLNYDNLYDVVVADYLIHPPQQRVQGGGHGQ